MFPGRRAPILPVIPTPENPMKPLVAIAGATSKQGRSVATTLLQRGQYRVRALTSVRKSSPHRSPSAMMPPGVPPFAGRTAPSS